jgi:hypothetical protein
MGFEDEVEQSSRRPYPKTDDGSRRTYELTSSIVPRRTSFHRSVEVAFPSIAFDLEQFSRRCNFPGPPELGGVLAAVSVLANVRSVPILLKNSFSADERNFSASLVHPTRGDVREPHRFPQKRSQTFVAVPQWLAAAEKTKTFA